VNRAKKEAQVLELADDFNQYSTFYLLDYVKIPVSKSIELRTQLRENDCSLRVVKNRLALRALKDEFPEELKEFFQGPTAIAYTEDNPIVLARLLRDFIAQNRILKVKGGLVEGGFLDGDKFKEISALNSKKDLVGKLGFLMAYPLTQFLKTMRAPTQSLGSMLGQLQDKKTEGP
jgi:large subunit ribosomal protein L10